MKKIVGFCLLIVSVLLSVSCTFAASGFGGGSRGDGWGSGGFSTGTTSTEVSYDALSSLALELNDRLASGEFGDVLKEVSCNIGVYSTVSGRDKYAIFYHYQASNYWYCNASGGLVYAYKDIDRISDLLGGNNGGIVYFLNRMEYVLTGSLLTAVNSINTATNSLLTTCNTISTKLDTLTSVISNGKVLVDNSDVVSAIQSIPAFDDTEITGYVGSITEWLNLFSRRYDVNYTNMLQQVTFLNESLDLLRKHVITGNRHTSEIIDMLTAAVDADTGKVLVADTAVTSAIADLTDSLSVPTGKCAHDWQLTSTGQPGTPAVYGGRIPSQFQEVEYIESGFSYFSGAFIPMTTLDYYVNQGTRIFAVYELIELRMSNNNNVLFGARGDDSRMFVAIGTSSKTLNIGWNNGLYKPVVDFSSISALNIPYTIDYNKNLFSLWCGNELLVDSYDLGTAVFRCTDVPISLFGYYGHSEDVPFRMRISAFRVWDNDSLVFDLVPCFRKSLGTIGFYDLVTEAFYPSSSSVSYSVKGADVPDVVITPGVPATYDTYTCSICGETYVDYDSTGAPEVTGVTIPFTRWFHGKFQEYEASLLSAIDAIPAYDDAAVIAAIQSIPAPTDYTSQLTAVVEKLDALLAKSNETVVNVINDNTYVPGVLYLDDSNSAVDTTKDGVSLFGGLVRWLWKNVFDGAFDAADITKLDGLFYDPAAAAEEVPDGS